jgi:triosephosphate isomerase (TIM)
MKPIIIGNWKMKLDYRESMKLAQELSSLANPALTSEKDVVVCPSHSCFLLAGELLKGSGIKIGVQDIFWEEIGAFTGCESPKFLSEAGCRYAIIGHSERRQNLGETDAIVHRKVRGALDNEIIPVLCVGETLDERQQGLADNIIFRQVTNALSGIELVGDDELVIAYEPVWVIGSGRPIDPEEAERAFNIIYQAVVDLWPLTIARSNVRIIYGGSIDAADFRDFSSLDHFSGFLIGGASLKAQEFIEIIKGI